MNIKNIMLSEKKASSMRVYTIEFHLCESLERQILSIVTEDCNGCPCVVLKWENYLEKPQGM